MSNYQNPRRRRRKRITGRFYAFLTIVLVLCVMVFVMINNRNKSSGTFKPASIPPTQVANATVTLPPVETTVAETPVPAPVDTTGGTVADPQAADTQNGGASTIDALIAGDPDAIPEVSEAEKVKVDNYSITPNLPSEWRNILLLGSDTRNLKKVERTDTIIIASINTNDGRIRLVSVMRDMMIPIPGKKDQKKINSASSYGGVDLTVKLVNEYFGMNISEYVLVNFASFEKVVDILGGVEVNVTKEEMDMLNKSIGEQAKINGYDQAWYLANKDSLELKTYGDNTHLTGMQALAYARIRKIDSDYQRTDRQRRVIDAILQKVRSGASAIQLMQLATSMWGELVTNIDMMSAVGLATTVIKSGAKIDKEWRLPAKDTYKSETRNGTSALYDVDFDTCKQMLYKFIYETA